MDENTQVRLSDLVDFVEALAQKKIEFDWQGNKRPYHQYAMEVQMLGTFTPEGWFLDEGRKAEGWPQMIIADYVRYQKQLAEAAQAQEQTDGIMEALQALRQQVADQAAEITRLKEAQVPDKPAEAPTDTEDEPAGEA